MIIELTIDSKLDERNNKAMFHIRELKPELSDIIRKLQNHDNTFIWASKEGIKYKLDYSEIISFTALEKRIYVKHKQMGMLIINTTLSSLDDQVPSFFLRISNSEIVNTKEIESIDFTFGGKIKLNFKTKEFTYSSRSYLTKIKKHFNL